MNINQIWNNFPPAYESPSDKVQGHSNAKMEVESITKNIEFNISDEKEDGRDNVFTQQYNAFYTKKLEDMRPILLSKAGDMNAKYLKMNQVSKDTINILIVGTIYRNLVNRTSFLKVVESSEYRELMPKYDNYGASETDNIFIEDDTGRRQITFENCILCLEGFSQSKQKVNPGFMISGLTVAVEASVSRKGVIQAHKVHFPGLASQRVPVKLSMHSHISSPSISDLLKKIQNSEKVNLVGFVSGFNISNNCEHIQRIDMLKDLITQAPDNSDLSMVLSKMTTLYILGNLTSVEKGINLNLLGSFVHETKFESMFQELESSIKKVGNFVADVASKTKVHIIPGESDPSDKFWPQAAFHPCMFSEDGNEIEGVSLSTNPSELEVSQRMISLSAGQNIKDIQKVSIVSVYHSYPLFFLSRI